MTVHSSFAAGWARKSGMIVGAGVVAAAATATYSGIMAATAAAATTETVVVATAVAETVAAVGSFMTATAFTVAGVAVPMGAAVAAGVLAVAALVWGGLKLWKSRKAATTAKPKLTKEQTENLVDVLEKDIKTDAKAKAEGRSGISKFMFGFAEVVSAGAAVICAGAGALYAATGLVAGTVGVGAAVAVVATGMAAATACYFVFVGVCAIDFCSEMVDADKQTAAADEMKTEAATAAADPVPNAA